MLKKIEDRMNCRDARAGLSIYFDEVLSSDERASLDCHLASCPLCRLHLSELQEARNLMRSLSREPIPASLIASIRNTVAIQLIPSAYGPDFRLIEGGRNWLSVWLMPSLAGSMASVVFGFLMIWAILATAPSPEIYISKQPTIGLGTTMLASDRRLSGPDILELSPAEYASNRLAVSRYSPSLNPHGALVEMTRSLVRGDLRDSEFVVVADVFSDGLARITDIVEPPSDPRSITEIRKALETDPAYAPFVPAALDNRSDTTRVVLRIQNVNVPTGKPRLSKRPGI